MGKVTEWYFKQNNIKNELENNLPSQEINTSKIEGTASWRISLYKGGEDVVSSKVLFDGLARYEEWKNQYEGYMEIDSPLFYTETSWVDFVDVLLMRPKPPILFFV